ncbi:hypothetical protein MKX03_013280 [Papaver bracteatum]|nr:hypothetical protein MKX03_013280 [Papaver bracteatum]
MFLVFQETDHLKMAVAKIVAHHSNVLLVEKSVSCFAQEHLSEKDISLVLTIKRPLLECIARCTGANGSFDRSSFVSKAWMPRAIGCTVSSVTHHSSVFLIYRNIVWVL